MVVRRVPQVRCDLAFNRAAADGKPADAAGRRSRVTPSCCAVKLDLVTASIGSRLNGMQIDAPSIPVTERQGGGQPVSFHHKTPGLEEPAACGDGVHSHNKVKIIVLPCLTLQERVDTPAAIDPGLDPCGLELTQYGEHLVARHHPIMISDRVRRSVKTRGSPRFGGQGRAERRRHLRPPAGR